MIDGHGYLRAGLTDDGLHPNAAGYEIMEPLVENAIEQSLRR
jgi:lysophospholipase L1-like esterase